MSGVNLLAGLYDAFGRGDVPGVLGSMDPAIHGHEAEGNPYMPSGEAWVGSDAIVNNLFMKLGEEWDGFTVHPETFHDAGDVVVVDKLTLPLSQRAHRLRLPIFSVMRALPELRSRTDR